MVWFRHEEGEISSLTQSKDLQLWRNQETQADLYCQQPMAESDCSDD
ncbi:hypothetical protein SOVF_065970 [Spinacia oleracea]|nr:hypothetical protein SOVF_065970 [Spinacia oleracea]